MPFNMFGSAYRNQVFGSFNRKANCQGSSQYCGNQNTQLLGIDLGPEPQQLQGNCSTRCIACLNFTNQTQQQTYNKGNARNKLINTNKKIQHVVGVSESEYISNYQSSVVSNGSRLAQNQIIALDLTIKPSYGSGTWNQSSDRSSPAGSQIKKPKTGSSIHVGIGVDVKHNSYARYLARLKGKNLKVNRVNTTQFNAIKARLDKKKPVVNNKPFPLMIVQQAGKNTNVCACETN